MNRRNAAWPAVLVAMSLLMALACNAPLEPEPTIAPPSRPDASATPLLPTSDPATIAPAETAPVASPESGDTATPRPTFTPIQEPTVASTYTAEPPTSTPAATHTPMATATRASSGPLSFTYQIQWQIDPANSAQAIATVTISATGGNGDYQYFRDEIEVDGPRFTYRWSTCRPNPGSFRVTSGDGQSVKQDYFSVPPCPTPVP